MTDHGPDSTREAIVRHVEAYLRIRRMPTDMAERWVREVEADAARAARRAAVPVALLIGLVFGLLVSRPVGATPRSADPSIPSSGASAQAVSAPTGEADPDRQTEAPLQDPLRELATPARPDSGGDGGASPAPVVAGEPQPTTGVPSPAVSPEPGKSSPAPKFRPTPNGHLISGAASWYCGHGSACTVGYPAGGLYAAAGPALRVGAWRGRYVTVTANGHSVRVQLVDYCGCPGRLVDLYSVAFARLAPLSRGLVTVTVRW